MLHLFRRHRADCSQAGMRSSDCSSKPKCPIHYRGVDGVGKRHQPQALKDPSSGAGVRDWNRAVEIIRDMELPAPPKQNQKPQTSMESAIASFLAFKAHRSPDVRRKATLILGRLKTFLEGRGKTTVPEVTFTDLVSFRAGWKEASTTQRRNQEVMKGFFRYCVKSEFVSKNPRITRPWQGRTAAVGLESPGQRLPALSFEFRQFPQPLSSALETVRISSINPATIPRSSPTRYSHLV